MESSLHLWISLVLSLVTTGITLLLVYYAGRQYHRYHDDRAALQLGAIVCLAVTNIGLVGSVLGVMIADDGLGAASRAITRVSLLLLAFLYLGDEWDKRQEHGGTNGR